MDYLEYFGLSAEPFSHAPNSRYYYASRQHTEALKRLLYAVNTMKGLALLIGDIGHGKTTLARRLLDALPENEFEAAMLVIVHAGVTASWLLKRIATQLGVENPAEDKLALLSQVYERLVAIHDAGKRAVVLIDEAQMLGTRELMEEFRGLLNLELPGHKLLSFVFFGLPDVEQNLLLDPPLAQRVALRYHLKALTLDETTAYVQHRLRLVGGAPELFPVDALAEVHVQSRGIPRVINTLCDNVLLEAYFARQEAASAALVSATAGNLGVGREATSMPPRGSTVSSGGVSASAAAAASAAADKAAEAAEAAGADAIVVVTRSPRGEVPAEDLAVAASVLDADEIASRVAGEGPRDEGARSTLGEHSPSVAAVAAASERDAPTNTTVSSGHPDKALRPVPFVRRPRPAEDKGPPAVLLAPGSKATTVDIDDPLAFLASAQQPAAATADSVAYTAPAVAPAAATVVRPAPAAAPAAATAAPSAPAVAAAPAPRAAQAAKPGPAGAAKAKSQPIDLSEIDDLLAELKRK